MLKQLMVVAALAIAGGVVLTSAQSQTAKRHAIVNIDKGASIYGPLRVTDPDGKLVLDVPAGSWIISKPSVRTAH